jgi:hypothetical protein
VTVSVNANASSLVTNTATVSGGGDVNTSNNMANDPTKVLIAPANLNATAVSSSQVNLTWGSVVNATGYQIYRGTSNGPLSLIGTSIFSNYIDPSVAANTIYIYQVRGIDSTAVGAPSNTDFASTIVFSDDPLVAGSTKIKAIHISELRTAVNRVRAVAGLPAATFTDPSIAAGAFIKAVHMSELRARLNEARLAIGALPVTFSDATLSAGTTVKAQHLRDLRAGIN